MKKKAKSPFIFLLQLEKIYEAERNTLSFAIVRRNEKLIPVAISNFSDSYIDLVQGNQIKKEKDFIYSPAIVEYNGEEDAFVFLDGDKESTSISKKTLIKNYGEDIIFG